MNTSVKRVKSKEALEAAIDDAVVEGWKLKSRGDKNAVLKKGGGVGTFGWHVIIFLLTAWFTLGLGNLIYAAYKYFSESQELRIKIMR